MSETPVEKRCTKCHEMKPLDAFGRDKGDKDGRLPECRVCRNARLRDHTAKNRDRIRARICAWHDARKGCYQVLNGLPVLKQRRLPFRNFPPQAVSTRIPASMHPLRAWITERVEAGTWQDKRTVKLVALLRRMCYDDVLVCNEWRLELLYLERGLPHFRLFWNGLIFGVADIFTLHPDLSTSHHISIVRKKLAAYLVAVGWQVENVVMHEGEAVTGLEDDVHHQYRLFKTVLETPAPRERVYDALRIQEAVS